MLVEVHVDELHTRRVRLDSHPVHRADRVRAREPDPQVGIEDDHAVADARRVLELVVVLTEGEGALGDHVSEAVEERDVVVLELPDPPTERESRLAHDDRDDRLAGTNGDVLHVGALGGPQQQRVTFEDLAVAQRPREERA